MAQSQRFYKSSRDSGRKIGYLSHHDKVHTYDNAIVDTAKKLLPSRHQMYAFASHMMVECMSEQCILTLQPRYNSTSAEHNKESNPIFEPVSSVHLQQDVWNRSPTIVQSRLRSKCGMHSNNGRIFAQKTASRRIPKSEYLPFLGYFSKVCVWSVFEKGQ